LFFEEDLEELLSTLVHDDDELKVLIAKPGGELWKDDELEDGLKERLPRSYEVYLEIIGEIMTVVESLKKELGVDVPAFQSKIEEVSLTFHLHISSCLKPGPQRVTQDEHPPARELRERCVLHAWAVSCPACALSY